MTTVETPRQIVATVTANATLTAGKHTTADATSGALTMTLPTAVTPGAHLSVEKVDATVNTVTVTGSIRGVGASSLTLVWRYESITFRADAAGSWWPTAGHKTKAALDSAYAPFTGAVFSGDVRFKTKPWIDPKTYGAIADGSTHPLSELYSTLTAAQAAYPGVTITALTQERDWAALQYAINLIPTTGNVRFGTVEIDGYYWLGADGLVSNTPGVRLLGLGGGQEYGTSTAGVSRIAGSGTQWLLTIGDASASMTRGWIFDDITFHDAGGTCAGGVYMKRVFFSRFRNPNFNGFTIGTGLMLDGTGDTCQYTEIVNGRSRGLFKAIDYISKADDTVIIGGSYFGTNATGSVGIHLGSSMRAIGANIQQFQTWTLMDGNGPMVDVVRGDTSGGLANICIDVAASAADAKIISPTFGGTYPTTAHIRVNSGANRTQIITPSTNGAASAVTIDSGTDTTLLSWADGLRLKGDANLTRGNGGTLVSANGFVTKTKSGAIADADYSAAPADGATGVDTSAGAFMYRSGGTWKSVKPSTGAAAPGLYAATSQASVSNSTTETLLDTYTIAGGVAAAGTTFRMKASGQTDNIATSGTLILRVRLGGLTGVTLGQFTFSSGTAARTGSAWALDAQVTFRTTGSSGTVAGGGVVNGVIGSGNAIPLVNSQAPGSTVNTGTSLDLVLTAQWATADPGNVIRRENATIELTKA